MTAVPPGAMMGGVTALGESSTPPPATRVTRPGWRDPRLWIGVAIVTVSVVVGARLLGSADDSVAVWAATDDLAAGHELTGDDVAARRVRFAEAAQLDRYFPADEALPAEGRLLRGVGKGELVPRAAVGVAEDTGLLSLPISVDPALVPPAVGEGSVVDVYVTATQGCRDCGGAALSAVTVVAAPATDQLTGTRQLVVAVEERDVERWFGLLAGLDSPVVTVAGRS